MLRQHDVEIEIAGRCAAVAGTSLPGEPDALARPYPCGNLNVVAVGALASVLIDAPHRDRPLAAAQGFLERNQ